MRLWQAAAVACVLAAFAAVPSQAIVPPTNCGMQTVSHKRYQIKADQLRCTTAKRYSRRYLASRARPSGYSCTNFKASETKLKFRCSKGIHVFFAIRH